MSARGELIRAGAPLVKNVTGFDLCRLLVGSLGTLACLGEVVLRCRPRSRWKPGGSAEGADPFALADALYRPLSVLWDGTRTWVGLAGYEVDVREPGRQPCSGRVRPVDGPPPPARAGYGGRGPPGALRGPARSSSGGDGGWLAEIGVGVVHCTPEEPTRLPAPARPGAEGGRPAPGHQGALRPRRAAQPRPVRPGRRPARAEMTA